MQQRKLLKITLIIAISLSLMCLVFVIHTIIEAPLDHFEHFQTINKKIEKIPNEIEELTTLSYEDLQNYHLFSKSNDTFEQIKQTYLDEQSIEVLGKSVLIKKNLVLEDISDNNCKRIFCFQKRMKFEKIPSLFWKGLIGVEDSRFLEHKGVDFKSILRAIIIDIKAMKLVQGGSTITQQLVKNLYFTNEKKIIRKLKELILAIYIEWKFDKEKILEGYFNEIFWGVKQGVYIKGIYSASLFYFSKRPSELSEYEVSILISLLKGPNFYNPINKIERLKDRTKYVFKRLKKLNFISDQSKPWRHHEWKSWKKKLEILEKERPYKSIYHASTFNTSIFSSFEKFVLISNVHKQLRYSQKKNKKVQLAVKASFYDFKTQKQFSIYSNPYREISQAILKERHQVGSILKPIIYSFFSLEGKSLDDMISVEPIELKLKSGSWSPREAHKVEVSELSLREALQQSYNGPVVRLAEEVGFDIIENYLVGYIPDIKKPLSQYPAQLLGAVELSVDEALNIYRKFIEAQCLQVENGKDLEETILYSMSDPSVTTIRRQVGEALGNLRFFGKTGTSNNGNDNWFVGFDGRLLSVFWFGNEGEKSIKSLGLYGSTTSFRIYRNYLNNRGKQVGDIGCHFSNKK